MADKNITRRLKIYVNGKEVDATLANLRKNLSKFRAASNRAVEGSEEWKKYNAEVAKLETELKEATSAQKQFRQDTKLTEAGISKSQAELSKFTGSLSTMINGYKTGDYLQVQEGFRGVATGIKSATKAALAFIATPIGAALAVLVGIGAAAKAWFNYNNRVIEALKLTTDITKLTDEAADRARINAETLQEVYGVEFKETLETAKKLVVQFGISYDEAFNVIEDGLKRGQKQNDEYFESLGEYGTFFKQAGYSAQEFKDIISTGYDLGIYKDKLPDAIKEADLAIKEQTTTTRDALVNAFGSAFTDEILNKVKTGEITTKEALQTIAEESDKTNINVQQNAQLTADLFKGAGEDAGGALKVFEALNVALTEQKKPLTESQQLLADQAKATKELKQLSSTLFATGDKGWGLLAAKAKLFGTKILVNILRVGVDVYNWFVDLNNESGVFSAVLTGIGKAATSSFKVIGILLSNAWDGFKSLGDIIAGIFTLDFDRIKEGFSKGFEVLPNIISDVKDQVVEDVNDIYDAFSGKNKTKKLELSSILSTKKAPTTDDDTCTEDDDKSGLTKEDQKIIDSKKKVAEFLKQWRADQELQKQLEDLEKDEAAQLKEELELEAKYEKLIEQAENETALLAELEEAKQSELDAIKKKWEDKFWADNEKNRQKEAAADKKYKVAQIKAEQALQQAKADALFAGLNILRSFTKEGSAEYKALFAMQQVAAAAEVILSGMRERAAYAANPTWSAMPDGGATIKKAHILASKIRTGISLATIAATTIKGFEEGGYTGSGDSGQVAGVVHSNEYVIPQPVMKDPEVPRIIEYLEAKRTGETAAVADSDAAAGESTGLQNAILLNAEMIGEMRETLQNLKINYTLEDERERQLLQKKLDDTITQSEN